MAPGETLGSEAGGDLGWAGPSACVLEGGHQKQPAADLPHPWMDGLPCCAWWELQGNWRERLDDVQLSSPSSPSLLPPSPSHGLYSLTLGWGQGWGPQEVP